MFMAIGKVLTRGRIVEVHDHNNRILFFKDLGTGYDSTSVGLIGHTATTVTIRMQTIQGIKLSTFDEGGKQIKMESIR